MEPTVFEARMTAVAEAFNQEDYAQSLTAARELKHDLIAQAQMPESTHGPDEGIQLGWARFYEIKSLFAQEDYQGVFDLLAEPAEGVPYTIGVKNAGWMYSVGAECALRVGAHDRITAFGEQAYDLRCQLEDDPMSVFQCVQTVLTLLDEAKRPQEYGPWAVRLIAIGTQYGADRPVIAGVDRLLDQYEATQDAETAQIIRDARPALAELCDGEFAEEAVETLERLDRVCPAA
ncbi:MAG: hypothetical protein ACYTGX_09285 [Planctomycetota bacterium]|jgi:hypothetical protein